MNKAFIMGRLARDPELRMTQNHNPVVSFTVAVDRDRAATKTTDFIDCVAWQKTAEFINNYFKKGRMILCEGSFISNKWETKDGEKRISWNLNVQSVSFCGDRPQEGGDASGFDTIMRNAKEANNQQNGAGGLPMVSDFGELEDDAPF